MKGCKGFLFFMLLVLFFMFSNQMNSANSSNQKKKGVSLGLKLGGGMTYMLLSDYNNFADDRNLFIESIANPGSFEGGYQNLNFGLDVTGEIILYFSPNFGVGLGTEYISKTAAGDIKYTVGSWFISWPYNYSHEINLRVIPVKLSFHIIAPLGKIVKFCFNIGGGYYFGNLDFKDGGVWYVFPFIEQVSTKMNTFGLHGGLGLEFQLSPDISFFMEFNGRYVEFDNIKGNHHWETESYFPPDEERTLYHYIWNSGEYIGLDWFKEAPAYYDDVRKAILDITGASASAGFIFRFGSR